MTIELKSISEINLQAEEIKHVVELLAFGFGT